MWFFVSFFFGTFSSATIDVVYKEISLQKFTKITFKSGKVFSVKIISTKNNSSKIIVW